MDSTRFELHETQRTIVVTLDRGAARITVQRTIRNDGARSDQATYWLDAATDGAIAVGLRSRGVLPSGAPVWFTGELMEAEAAAAKYKELTGHGGYTPKDPALLSWRSASQLALQVFPVPPKDDKVVEVTSLAPMTYESGAYTLKLPLATDEHAPAPRVLVRAARAGDRVSVNGVPASTEPAALSGELTLTLRPYAPRAIDGELASIAIGPDRFVTHARMVVAPRLSTVPDGAAIALVIDASRSQEDVVANETALARSYLSHFPHATVEVFTFDREVHRLTPQPVSVKDAIARLYEPIAVANGSRVDDAIARADASLATQSAQAKRMLVLSDFRVRMSLSPTHLALRKLTSGAVVHLASVSGGDAALSRDDENVWARIPHGTGGVFWHAAHPDRVDADSRARMLELARPIHLDAPTLSGLATPFDDFAPGGQISEGEGYESWSIDGALPTAVSVEGLLWSTPARFSIARDDAAAARRAAALVFGTGLLGDLSEPEMMTLATKGGAVSPVTSYLAIEPGVRPSTEGLEEHEGSGVGFGSGRSSVREGSTSVHRRPDFDAYAYLIGALGPAARTCGARRPVHVSLETTFAEVVDVGDVVVAEPRDVRVESCVREAVWKLTLPAGFDSDWMGYSFDLGP